MNILVFGSSIEQGFDDTEKGGWVNRLFLEYGTRQKGQPHGDFHAVFNLGISGETSDGIVRRFKAEMIPRLDDENLTIFESGGNDSIRNLETGECAVPLERFKENCRTMVAEAKKYGKVAFLGLYDSDHENMNPMPWYEGHAALAEDAAAYNEAIKKMAEEQDVLYIPVNGLFDGDFERYTYDGDHPNAEGHRLIYERVKGELEKAGIL